MGNHRQADEYVRSVRYRLSVAADASARAVACATWGPRPCALAMGATRLETRRDGTRCLYQDPSVPTHVRHWMLARALASSLLAGDGVDLPVALVASSLMLPESTIVHELCESAESLASRYVAPVGAVLLRVADLAQRPTALVLPHWSRVAGNERGALPTDHPTLRELAFGRVALLRLQRTRTPDGEIALRVA